MLLSGTLADLDLASIAAVTSLGRSSLRLELRQSSGDLIGSLVLKAGRVVSATAGGVRGRDALRVIMSSAADTRFQLAHEPLDFALSSALASVDELWKLARGTTGSQPVRRPPPDDDDPDDDRDREGTLSLRPGSRPRTAPPSPARAPMMQGRLAEFDLLTLLQTVGVGRQLVEIEVRDRAGKPLGMVRVKSGKLVAANTGRTAGVDAVAELLRAAASFQFVAFRVATVPDQLTELASVAEIASRLAGDVPRRAAQRDRVVLEGLLSDFDLPTLLHTVGCSRQYCALEVHDERATRGTICVKAGIVVSATAGELTGIPAVQQLIASHGPDRFRLTRLAGELPDHAPLGPVGQILLHADAPAPAVPRLPTAPIGSPAGPGPSPDDRAALPRAAGLAVMEGTLADFDVRTVLEVLAATRQHARLQILDPGQPPLGEVTLKAGWIISSQAGALRGTEALTFLLGASPRLQFRVLTVAEGFDTAAPLGSIHDVLDGLPTPRPGRSESSTRILRWAIPISFALGGTMVFLVTRGGTTTRAVEPRDPPAVQRDRPPPPETAAPRPRPAELPASPAASAPPAAPALPAPAAEPPAAAAGSPPAGAASPSAQASAPPAPSAPAPSADASAPPAPSPPPPGEAPPPVDPPAPPAGKLAGLSVKNAQAAMKQLGYDPGPIDNTYGRQTRSAIRQFQRSQHLRATGTLDPETWSAIVAQLMAQRPAP